MKNDFYLLTRTEWMQMNGNDHKIRKCYSLIVTGKLYSFVCLGFYSHFSYEELIECIKHFNLKSKWALLCSLWIGTSSMTWLEIVFHMKEWIGLFPYKSVKQLKKKFTAYFVH